MPSQAGVELYYSQSVQPASELFHQATEMYNDQQIVASPRGEYFVDTGDLYKQQRPDRDFITQVRDLQRYYTILDDDGAISQLLATEPALYSLLIEAVEPLRHAFGDKRLIYARIQSSDEDSLLKVVIRLPIHFSDDPECALQTFDEEWWLNNCHRSGGALVFDYEM
jgi:hypothetical protein